MNSNEIEFKDSFKYLGVHFNKLLKFNKHANFNLNKANRVKGAFSMLFNNKSLSQKTKLLLYKVSIRPVLLYAFSIWFSISPTVMRKMEIFERQIVRKCIEKNFQTRNKRFSNHFIYEKASLSQLSDYALNLMKRFVERLTSFEGNVIKDILSSEVNFNWSNTNYLSAIGILREQTNDVPGNNFFSRPTPGIHRG